MKCDKIILIKNQSVLKNILDNAPAGYELKLPFDRFMIEIPHLYVFWECEKVADGVIIIVRAIKTGVTNKPLCTIYLTSQQAEEKIDIKYQLSEHLKNNKGLANKVVYDISRWFVGVMMYISYYNDVIELAPRQISVTPTKAKKARVK